MTPAGLAAAAIVTPRTSACGGSTRIRKETSPPGAVEATSAGSVQMVRCAFGVLTYLVPADGVFQDAGPKAPDSTAKPPHVIAAAATAAPVASAVPARSFAHEMRDTMSPPNTMFHTVPVCVPRIAALSHRRPPYLAQAGPDGVHPRPGGRKIGSRNRCSRAPNSTTSAKVVLSAMTSGAGPLVLEPAVAAVVEEQRPASLISVQVVYAADHDDMIARLVLGLG